MSALPETGGSCETASDGPLWVWGLDVSTKRVSLAYHGPDSGVVTLEVPSLKHGARLSAIYEIVRTVAPLLASARPPIWVWVEQPAAFGRMPEPQLMYAVGVVQAALHAALVDRYAHPTEVQTIAIATWKKTAVGKGNAKKHEVLAWARADGYEGSDQDEADAWAIARAGQRLVSPAISSVRTTDERKERP